MTLTVAVGQNALAADQRVPNLSLRCPVTQAAFKKELVLVEARPKEQLRRPSRTTQR